MKQQTATDFPPGSQWRYSNTGYAVLAMIVEKVSGKAFGEFLQERIFAPLQMTNTLAYEEGKNEVPHRALGYTKKNHAWVEADQSSTSAVLGDGGIYSNVEDLAKWDRALRRAHATVKSGNAAGVHSREGSGWGEERRRRIDGVRFRMVSRSLPRPPAYMAFGYYNGLSHIHRPFCR